MRTTSGRRAVAVVIAGSCVVLAGYVGQSRVGTATLASVSAAVSSTPAGPVAAQPTGAPLPSPTVNTPSDTSSAALSSTPLPSPQRVAPTVTVTARPSSPTPPPPSEPPPVSATFTVGTFNVLGASHTAARGNRPGRASGVVRARRAAVLLARHGAEVVGFQELQGSQLATLQRHTAMDFYPGFSMRPLDTENSIGWRRDRWALLERHTLSVPYFAGGLRAMPYVRLRHLATGLEAWFANVHNPADTRRFPRQQRFRDRATRLEIDLANRLIATGLPVFLTGDMNERASYFCAVTSRAPLVAARGGRNTGRCLPEGPRSVDWIFGSQGVQFDGYVEDRGPLVDITTDHPVVMTRATITGTSETDQGR